MLNGASAVTGAGDPFCPSTNRPGHPSPNATRFAPVVPGDSLSATGNFERVGGVQFLSAHTVKVFADVTTQNLPTQPDYMIFNDVGWDAPPYPGSRVGARFLGATSLHDSQVDIYSVHYDAANVPHEIPLETTVNNPTNGAVVFLGLPTGTFDTVLNVDFTKGIGPEAGLAPCPDLITGGVPGISAFCSNPSTLSQNFRLMSPIAREVVGRTRHKATLSPGVVTRDIRGNAAPNGQYLTPVGIEYPGMAGIDLGRIQTPFSFSGVPWNLDRRLSPGGCIGPCEGTPQPLSPFPFEGIDPRTQSLLAPVPVPSRILSFYPFGPSDVLAWPPADPASIGITPVEPLALACSPGAARPLAIDDLAATSLGVPVTIDVLANDVSVFSPVNLASVTIGTGPVHGTAVPDPATGEVLYTPAPGYAGPDAFTYTYMDLAGAVSNAAAVDVTVSPTSVAPVAVNDNVVTIQNATVAIHRARQRHGSLLPVHLDGRGRAAPRDRDPGPRCGHGSLHARVQFHGKRLLHLHRRERVRGVERRHRGHRRERLAAGGRQRFRHHGRESRGDDPGGRQRHGGPRRRNGGDRLGAAPRHGGS